MLRLPVLCQHLLAATWDLRANGRQRYDEIRRATDEPPVSSQLLDPRNGTKLFPSSNSLVYVQRIHLGAPTERRIEQCFASDKRIAPQKPGASIMASKAFRQLSWAAVVAAATPAVAQTSDYSQLVEGVNASVVRISAVTDEGSRLGSGFLVDGEGVIVTNRHVIAGANGLEVRLSNGDTYSQVQLLAEDRGRDLAILRIPGFGLPAAALGNSDSVRVGHPVVVIGSPLGLDNTVSAGIISGVREFNGTRLLQITAPISPGSSGGAVFTPSGEVIGIAVSQLKDGQNLNFAVPINYARGLLAFLPDRPAAVFESTPVDIENAGPPANADLVLTEAGWRPYTLTSSSRVDKHQGTRDKTSYQIIDAADGSKLIERYEQHEAVFIQDGREQIIGRGSRRSTAIFPSLVPLESYSEWHYLADGAWHRTLAQYKYAGGRVVGHREDSRTGRVEVNRRLPSGVIGDEWVGAAIALLSFDSLTDRSLEITTYSPQADEIETIRVKFGEITAVRVGDQVYEVYRTSVSGGSRRSNSYYMAERPRALLGGEGHIVEKLEWH